MTVLPDRLRNPEHTGERRCWPCTAVNAAILLLACAGVARRRSRPLAAALALAGGATIALRGYLVPYTPRFAPRLVSKLPLVARLPGDPFHAGDGPSHPAIPAASGSLGDGVSDSTEVDSADVAGERVLAALLERGVVVEDGDSLSLSDDFREAWRAEMRDLRDRSEDGLAAALRSVAPEGTVADVVEPPNEGPTGTAEERWFVVSDGSDDPANERWLIRPIAVAEAAAAKTLADRTDLDEALRVLTTGPLRTFLEVCPVCDGPVVETTTVECCGGPGGTRPDAPDEVLACEGCGARLYTFR